MCIWVGQGLQKHRIHNGKHQRVRSRAERKRENCDGRKSRLALTLAHPEAQVLQEVIPGGESPNCSCVLLNKQRVAKIAPAG